MEKQPSRIVVGPSQDEIRSVQEEGLMAERPELLNQGKVRDIYPGDDPDTLLVVATDRISVFDVVLPQEIPGKGVVLTHITNHWLRNTPVGQVMPNHLLPDGTWGLPSRLRGKEYFSSTLVRRLDMLPIEAVVRGYLAGSGWKDYLRTGTVGGIELPEDMEEMERLTAPVYAPATKAKSGHDENIGFEDTVQILGDRSLAEQVRDRAIELYTVGAQYALERGIILVDTKFEFGINPLTGELTLGDEVLTPDSSRFVAASTYKVGSPPQSMDKQIVRNYYDDESLGWDKTAPAPDMPHKLVMDTRATYHVISERLTGLGSNDRSWWL